MKSTKSWLVAALVAAFVMGGVREGKGVEYNKKTTPHEITLGLYFELGSLDQNNDNMTRLDQWKEFFDEAAFYVWNYTGHQAGIKEVQVYRYSKPENCDVTVKNGTAYVYDSQGSRIKINSTNWPQSYIYKFNGNNPKITEITLPRDIETLNKPASRIIAHEMGHGIFGVADEYKVYCWSGGNFDKAKTHRDFDYSNATFFDYKNFDFEHFDFERTRFVKCQNESDVYGISPGFRDLKGRILGDVANAYVNKIIPGPETIMNQDQYWTEMSIPNQGDAPWEWNMHYRKWEGGFSLSGPSWHYTWGAVNFATPQEFCFHKSAWERMKDTRGIWFGGKEGDCPDMEWRLMDGSPVVLIVLDASGSMQGTKWDEALKAAKLVVEIAWLAKDQEHWAGDYVGAIRFSDSATTILPLKEGEVTDKTKRSSIANRITGRASGGTHINAALQHALSELRTLRPKKTGPECIILLSDGQSQDTVTDATLNDLKTRGVRVNTVAITPGADEALMQRIARETEGYYGSIVPKWYSRKSAGTQSRSLLSNVNLSQFFADLYAEGRESEQIARLDGVATGNPMEQEIVVDSYGNLDLTVNLFWETGDMDLSLVKPDGTVIERATAEVAESDLDGGKKTDSAFIRVNNPEAGMWKVRVIPAAGSGEQAYLATVSCTGRDNMRLYAETSGDSLTWPAPLVVSASFGGAVPAITGAVVTAVATCPDGTEVPFVLYDDGENGDEVAGDGVYAAEFKDFTEDGEYRFEVEGKNVKGKTSWRGHSPAEGGELPDPEPVEPFVRRKSLTVQYDGLPEFINATRYTGTEFASWTLNRNTGAMTGSLVVSNQPTSRKTLIAPFWYAVTETVNVFLAKVDGYTDDGDPYVNISDKVEAALQAKYGRKSMAPGEWVTIDGVEVYSRNRSIPDMTALWSLWADPPAGSERRIDSYDRDANGVLDDEEILLAVEHWEALDMDDEALLKRIALWKQGDE